MRRQSVLAGALLVLLVVITMGALGAAPAAGAVLALLLFVLAILRLALPTRAVGALAVRSRGFDAAGLLVLAVAIAVLSTAPNL